MDQVGSGGVGAVFIPIPAPVLALVVLVVLVLVVFGAWKLIKLLLALAG